VVARLVFLLLFASQALAQSTDKRGLFTDPEDGKLWRLG
jgi:hypothetical protein